MADLLKRLYWIASSKKDLAALPAEMQSKFGYELRLVQQGEMPPSAKVLHGFKGASVLEIRGDHEGNTFRAVYTVRFGEFVYVLHVFQKKSTKGSKTPTNIIDLVKKRLKLAERDYEDWKASQEKNKPS